MSADTLRAPFPWFGGKSRVAHLVWSAFGADVSDAVREWAIEHGNNKRLRIAVCGYEGEHEFPADWQCVAWKAAGGYAAAAGNTENSAKERIWFSPWCERAEDQADLFSKLGGAA